LQSNKVNKIVNIPNLWVIETVDSESLADKLHKAWKKSEPLKIMIQVNTSNEEQKNGLELNLVNKAYEHILNNCKNLDVTGLMTIGSVNESFNAESGLNQDFLNLIECRSKLNSEFGLDQNKLELSMGMSSDFEKAIQMGSTSVRVGSLIFGEREKK